MAPRPLKFEIDATESFDDKLTAWSGLTLVYEVLLALGVIDSIKKHIHLYRSLKNLEFDEADQLAALVLLIAAGGDCFADLEVLRSDKALCRLLERSFPSPETTRQFLYLFHQEALVESAQSELPLGKKAYVPEESKPLQDLSRVLRDFLAAFQKRWPQSCATLDIDTTFQESHKKEAKDHYQEGPGYHPLLATWVEQKLVVHDSFRDGNVPSHFDVLDSVRCSFAALPEGVEKRRMRADSAMYVIELLRWLCKEEIEFAIGVRMRDSLLELCKSTPEAKWVHLQTRADSTLHLCEVEHQPKEWKEEDPKLRYVAIRITPNQSELFDEQRDTKYLAVVTNRDVPMEEVAKWYWEKGGTIEHVHDVLKNELGAGTLPCGRFGSNAAWLRVNVLTFNVLEAVRRVSPPELKDARPKRLRLSVLAIPALVVNHARELLARMAERGKQMLASRAALWKPVLA
jgi:hypothetical protein